jgi:uncharacterized protein with HEPN domain
MRDERLLLKDILVALDRIDLYTKGMTYESFITDEKTANAVVYNFSLSAKPSKCCHKRLLM